MMTPNQWPFQEPKLEVPTICKGYIRPIFQGISPENMAKNMVLTYLHLLDPEDLPLTKLPKHCQVTASLPCICSPGAAENFFRAVTPPKNSPISARLPELGLWWMQWLEVKNSLPRNHGILKYQGFPEDLAFNSGIDDAY